MKKPGSKADLVVGFFFLERLWNFWRPWCGRFYQDPSPNNGFFCFGRWDVRINFQIFLLVASIGEPYLWEGLRSSNFRAPHFGGLKGFDPSTKFDVWPLKNAVRRWEFYDFDGEKIDNQQMVWLGSERSNRVTLIVSEKWCGVHWKKHWTSTPVFFGESWFFLVGQSIYTCCFMVKGMFFKWGKFVDFSYWSFTGKET